MSKRRIEGPEPEPDPDLEQVSRPDQALEDHVHEDLPVTGEMVIAECNRLGIQGPMPHQAGAIARMVDTFLRRRIHPEALLETGDPIADKIVARLRTEPCGGFLLGDGMGVGKTYQASCTAILLRHGRFEIPVTVHAAPTPTPPTPEVRSTLRRRVLEEPKFHKGKSKVVRPTYLARSGQKGPTLVVLNASLISTWQEQFARHYKTLLRPQDCFVFTGTNRVEQLRERWRSVQFVFCTYETLRSEALVQKRLDVFLVPWQLIILDEVHKLRNGVRSGSGCSGSGLWKAMRRFPSDIPKLGLSGTLICNHVMELCAVSQVVFKGHSILSSESFWEEYQTRFTPPLVRALRSAILLRRTIASLGIKLPPKELIQVDVYVSLEERRLYEVAFERMLFKHRILLNLMESHGRPLELQKARNDYCAAVQRLGLCATTWPQESKDARSEDKVEDASSLYGERLETEAGEVVTIAAVPRPELTGKELALVEIVNRVFGFGHEGFQGTDGHRRLIVTSRFVSFLERLRDVVFKSAFPQLRTSCFTGSLNFQQRGAMIDAFRAGAIDIFCLSSMAGCEGIDLTCAQDLVLCDTASMPNPSIEDQIEARVYRIGQKLPTRIYKLVTQGSVDVSFSEHLHVQKRANASAMLDEDALPPEPEASTSFVELNSMADLLKSYGSSPLSYEG